MKKLMISLAALAAIGSAVPAAAQSWGGYGNGYGNAYGNGYGYGSGYGSGYSRMDDSYARMNDKFVSMSRRIDTAQSHNQISPAEANRLRREVRSIALDASRFGRDGLDSRETARVTARLQRVSQRLGQYSYRAPYRFADRYGPSDYGDRDWRD